MDHVRSRGRSFVVPALVGLAVLGPALGCRRDTGTAQLTGATSSASPPTAATAARIPDADIAQAITRHLKADSAVSSEQVKVAVTDGVCTLSGSVGNLLAKRRALRVAETLRGVRSVIDQVEVRPISRTDAELAAAVTRELGQDPVTRAKRVGVSAKDGKVTLTGVAGSWPEKGFFTQVAETVRGVKSVDNQIAVKYPLVPSETQIAADVRHRIANDIWLDGNPIEVTVTGHTVHLKGVVGSVAEKNRAHSDGWMVGVDEVDGANVVVDAAARDDQRRAISYAFRSDDQIAHAVRDSFKLDPRLAPAEPKVAVREGVVELTGTVATATAKRAAELDAKDTVGVWDVRNLAIVEPASKPSDADIDRAVKRALAEDPLLPGASTIRASTSKGKVVLGGKIKSGIERVDAVEDVMTVLGVVGIVDQLQIDRSPQDVKADIDDRLYWDAAVQRDRVKVAVAPDNVATLSGTLDSWSENRAAVEDATSGGATRVVNLLVLKKPPKR
jgi:osmotically-inducible protein OsmY